MKKKKNYSLFFSYLVKMSTIEKRNLLEWCKVVLENKNLFIHNFKRRYISPLQYPSLSPFPFFLIKKSLKDGIKYCALVNVVLEALGKEKKCIDILNMNSDDPISNLNLAAKVSKEQLGIEMNLDFEKITKSRINEDDVALYLEKLKNKVNFFKKRYFQKKRNPET